MRSQTGARYGALCPEQRLGGANAPTPEPNCGRCRCDGVQVAPCACLKAQRAAQSFTDGGEVSGASQRATVVALLWALSMKSHTVAELSFASGLSEKAVSAWLKALRNGPAPLVMVGDWRVDGLGRHSVPAYAWGLCGRDMDKPAPLTRSQITARHRAKKSKEKN